MKAIKNFMCIRAHCDEAIDRLKTFVEQFNLVNSIRILEVNCKPILKNPKDANLLKTNL